LIPFFSRGQIQVYKDQVQQFSMTIIQLEKDLEEQQNKFEQLQTDSTNLKQNSKEKKKQFSCQIKSLINSK